MKRKRFEISNNISNICNNSNKEIHLPEKIRPHLSRDIPEDFLCPISLEIMKDPVIAADGHTYDRENITKWLSQKRRRSILCSPLDGSKLDNINLQQNIFARKIIDSFLTMDAFKINNTKGLPRFEEISIMPDNLDDFNTKLFNHELQLKKQISTLEELYRKSMIEIKEKENTINLLTKGNLSLKNKIESNAQLKKEITQLEIRNNKLKEVLNNRENHNDIINKENIFLKNEIERITLINEDIIQNQKSNNQKLINEQTDLIAIKKDNIFFYRCLIADNGKFKNRIPWR